MDEPLTRDYLDSRIEAFDARLDARLARALSIQTVVTIGGIGAIIVLVEALA